MFAIRMGAIKGNGYANSKSVAVKHLQVCRMHLRPPRVCCVIEASTTGLQPRCASDGRAHVTSLSGAWIHRAVAVHRSTPTRKGRALGGPWVHLYVLLSVVS
jgi:hypothetical protein